MAEKKKYYWLKLKNDFFKRHDIRIVESMTNGKDYVLFYLKLLVESVSHDGNLRFSETIPYSEEMLSTITNTNIDIVRSAIKIFTELKLMDILDDDTIYMLEVEKMTGAETEWAEKKRIYRQNQLAIETNEGQKKTLSDKSKSKSIELEKDSSIYTYCEQAIGSINSTIYQELTSWSKDIDEELIRLAIDKAVENNVRKYAYIKTILNSWLSSGYKTVADVELNDTKKNDKSKKPNIKSYQDRIEGEYKI